MTAMPKRRVLVIEDSLTVRKRLVEVLARAFDVVGEAVDGQAGIELCERLRPDVVTMDMMMPHKNGVEATEHIMAYCPTPILIVSASTNRGELFKTYDALAAGAVDVLEKPHGEEPDDAWERRLVAAVETVARIPVITHPRLRFRKLSAPRAPQHAATPPEGRVIAIGASTGGPRAVLSILKELPADFALPILLVIHIAEPFGTAFADWLDSEVALAVRYPRVGESPSPGTVLMAPPGSHMQVRGQRIALTSEPERHSCRPSVDVLFESVAREYGARGVGCLLTGMGKDGAVGLAAIRTAGGMTVAQDAATSVVFGMPGEAVRIGAAVSVLPLAEIAPALLGLSQWHAEPRRAP
jgi:two-component system chemotaxis response regulator CheB